MKPILNEKSSIVKKISSLAFFLFTSAVFSVHGQKVKVQSAYNHLKYGDLDLAKGAIDEAVTNDQTKEMAKAWYYRGLIYQALYKDPKFGSLDANPPSRAFASYLKALEIEPKGEFADDINSRLPVIAFYKGIEEYKAKNYTDAFVSFEFVTNRNPGDTLAVLYAAYSADYSGQFEKSLQYYSRLISMNYTDPEPEKTNIYLELSTIYKKEIKDTTKALEYVLMGRKKFPEAVNLIKEEANIYMQTGRPSEAIDRLEIALEKNPGDYNLQLVMASLLDGMWNTAYKKKDPAANEYFIKADAAYKKVIQMKSDFFEAYYNLGAMIFNQGADMANAANEAKSDKEYQAAKAKADEKLKQSLPFLEKAYELNPTDRNTLISLKQLYIRLGETEKYNRVKAILDNLK